MRSEPPHRPRLTGLAAALASAVLAGCLEPIPENTLTPDSPPVRLLGRVLDVCSGAGLPEALLTLSGRRPGGFEYTELDGGYELRALPDRDLPPGSLWSVEVSKAGYLGTRESLVISDTRLSRNLHLRSGPSVATDEQHLELLLVVDNSPGMVEHQTRLFEAFPHLVRGLLEGIWGTGPGNSPLVDLLGPAGLPKESVKTLKLHLGALSGDQACRPAGGLQLLDEHWTLSKEVHWTLTKETMGASEPKWRLVQRDERVFISSGGERQQAFDQVLQQKARPLLMLGESGCSYQQPFQAALTVLGGSFHTPSVPLIILVLTRGDECSPLDSFDVDPAQAAMRCFQSNVACSPGDWEPGARWGCALRDDRVDEVQSATNQLRETVRGPLFLAVLAGDAGPVAIDLDERGRRRLRSVCVDSTLQARDVAPSFHLRGLVDRLRPWASLDSLCGEPTKSLRDLGSQAAQTLLWAACPALQ